MKNHAKPCIHRGTGSRTGHIPARVRRRRHRPGESHPVHPGIRAAAGLGSNGLRPRGTRKNRSSGVCPRAPAHAVHLRPPQPHPFLTDAGAGMPPEPGTVVVAGSAPAGSQHDLRLSQGQPQGAQEGIQGLRAGLCAAGAGGRTKRVH